MPKTAMIRARTEPKLKREVESIFRDLGMSSTEAINIFYKQVRMRKGIPFAVKILNKLTKDTFAKSEKRKGLKSFKTVEDLLNDLKTNENYNKNKPVQKRLPLNVKARQKSGKA